ncbi:hypothetical protein [Corynebacterium nuruki]|uniref:hypothetical protein n=1 Tax=Corynebacterium nuruki TaxID=1032851 RepID=UPI0039BFB784
MASSGDTRSKRGSHLGELADRRKLAGEIAHDVAEELGPKLGRSGGSTPARRGGVPWETVGKWATPVIIVLLAVIVVLFLAWSVASDPSMSGA